MNPLGRLIIIGGGLAIGLLAVGVNAAMDRNRIKRRLQRDRKLHSPRRRTDLRRYADLYPDRSI